MYRKILVATDGSELATQAVKTGARVFVLLGDGELQEGQNWEAMMAAAKFQPDNPGTDNDSVIMFGHFAFPKKLVLLPF